MTKTVAAKGKSISLKAYCTSGAKVKYSMTKKYKKIAKLSKSGKVTRKDSKKGKVVVVVKCGSKKCTVVMKFK